MRWAAFVLAFLWLLGLFVAWSLGATPAGLFAVGGLLDWLVLLGGPGLFLAGTLLALWRENEAGALLWLGAAAASVGLSLRSGPHLGAYFLGMALLALPEAAVGTLFLLDVRRRRAAVPPAKARRR